MVSLTASQYNLPEHANSLLEFKERLDINLLDQVVCCVYQGGGQHQHLAQQLLTQLKEHPDAWTRVDAILEYSSSEQTKYFALQILEGVIKTKWKALPHEQCEGIQKYIVALIIKLSASQEEMDLHKVYLNKLNVILVQIVKQEWPKNWPTFISDIVGASRTNESLCQNNMIILKLLSEEVFDFSSGQMTQAKARHLKESMCSEFSDIFNLCVYVMDNSSSFGLVESTLQTLLRFLNWIPLGYIFETKLFTTLIYKFLQIPQFRNVTLKCLTEIASIKNDTYNEQFLLLFTLVTSQLKLLLPLSTNIREAYHSGRTDEQHFIQNLALFFSSFLREHGELLESKPELHNTLLEALHYLVLVSEVEETEIFKICLDYWSALAQNLYKLRYQSIGTLSGPGQPTGTSGIPGIALYEDILCRIRQVMIGRMCKPEEVLIVENEQGEVVREFMKDTDAINMYKTMRETLVYLTHLDFANTEQIMTEKLSRQVDGSEWSWKNLNTLCWAIGSISGSMHEEDEKRFLVTVIKELLSLCEMKRGKDNKAIIASNIMYIVGQYPRFLKAHWKFLKTVVNKLFEFMHETHEGVQDMACDTFIKIAQKCKRHFVVIQRGEAQPNVEDILHNISGLICDLEPQQVHTFYEAVGYMISSQTDPVEQEKLIVKYMSLPNQIWDGIINRASRDIETLNEQEIIKQLAHILKTNVRACIAVGHAFITQLGRIYMDMLNIYKVLSENISQAIAAKGPTIMKDPIIRSIRTVKKETLKLISSWVSRAEDPNLVRSNFLPPLLSAILLDYNKNVAEAREPEVLSCVTAIVEKLEGLVTEDIPPILDSLFECTLEMINKDLEQYPDFRLYFFKMLYSINKHCFQSFLHIPPQQFKLFLDAVIWAFKHTMRNVAEVGLSILFDLLKNVEPLEASQAFYQTYYMDLLNHLFSVVTDLSHAHGLTMQCTILAYLFYIIESGVIRVPLYDPAVNNQDPAVDNVRFVKEQLATLFNSAYSHLQPTQIQLAIEGLFSFNRNVSVFKDHLRDFLVQTKEFSGEDDSELYIEEKENEMKKAQEEKRSAQLTVPGIINPHDRPDESMEA